MLIDKRIRQPSTFYFNTISTNQNGAALVVAMVILLVVTMLAVTGANQSLLSEKMASNHNTQTDAFFAAESGVDSAIRSVKNHNYISLIMSGNTQKLNKVFSKHFKPYASKHKVELNNKDSIQSSFYITHVKGTNSYWNESEKVFELISHGVAGKNASRNIKVKISPAVTNSPFLGGIIGRKGVSIKGTPVIDSYNSSYGVYGKKVTAHGNTFKNTSINTTHLRSLSVRTCWIPSNSNKSSFPIKLNGSKSAIYGNVSSSGKFIAKGHPSVYGKISTNVHSKCNAFQNIGQLNTLFSSVRVNPNTNLLNKTHYSNLKLGHAGKRMMYIATGVNKFKVNNLSIAGNVTLMIPGDFNLNGKLNIGHLASLRLLVTGKTSLVGNSIINVNGPFVRKNVNGKLTPAFSLYSNNMSKNLVSVKIAGNNSSHIAVYAPNSTVKIAGKGSLYGSVVAKKIQHKGTASIHYDEALKKISVGGIRSSKVRLKSWQQLQG